MSHAMTQFTLRPNKIIAAVDEISASIDNDHAPLNEVTAAFQTLVDQCYGASLSAGWYSDLETGKLKTWDPSEKLMLVVSELAEAMEGHRKGLQDDKLPHRKMAEVELADALIRLADHAGACGHQLGRAIWTIDHLSSAGREIAPELNPPVYELAFPGQLLALTKLVCAIDSSRVEDHEDSGYPHPPNQYGSEPASAYEVLTVVAMAAVVMVAKLNDFDLPGAVGEKMEYNSRRPDHKIEARRAAGGKAY